MRKSGPVSIRIKILSIVGGVILALVAVLAGASYHLVAGRFAQLELKKTQTHVERIHNEIEDTLAHLEAIAGDWAPWDDAYRFVVDLNPAFVENNLPDTTFANLRLNFMLFFNQDHLLVFSKFFALDPSQTTISYEPLVAAIEGHSRLLSNQSENSHWSGIVMTPDSPFLVAGRPIVTSEFKGPIHGTLVLGRMFDTLEVQKLSKHTNTQIEITRIEPSQKPAAPQETSGQESQGLAIYASAIDRQTIAGYAVLPDLFNRPTLLLKIVRDRDIFHYGLTTWRQNALMLFGFGLAFIALLLFLLDRLIINRLEELSYKVSSIAHSPDHFERIGIQSTDEIGQLAQTIDTLLDARQQHQNERADNEKYLRHLLDSIHCGVMVVDAADHHVVDINAAGLTIFDGPREAVVGKLCHRLVCPNDVGNCPVTDHGATLDLSERRLLRADGSILPILKSVAHIQRRGRNYLIESFIDISRLKIVEAELRASEACYRQFFEDDLTGDFLMSNDGQILDCNPALAKMFGYNSVEEVKSSLPGSSFLTIEDHSELMDRLQTEDRLEGIELEFHRHDGQPFYGIANLIGIFDQDHALREVRGYVFDDTKRVLLEKDLRQAQKMEAIGTLAGGIAHDFNNILASVMGYTEIALSELPETTTTAGRLKHVLKSAGRAKELVQQIMAFSRQNELESHPLNVRPILKETAKLIRDSLPRSIDIRTHHNSTAKVKANPAQIHQIVSNLGTNAGYAMKKCGGCLTISDKDTHLDKAFTDRYPGVRAGTFVCISIADTGPGIPPQIMDRIFDPFFSTKDKNEGAGLGLSVVHGIVSKLKGAIAVKSSPHGSQFDVYLPAVNEQRQLEPLPNRPSPAADGVTLVFVDDEPHLVEMGIQMLKTLGYRADGFTDAQKALAYTLNNPDKVNLVIADMSMPGLSGVSMAARLYEALPQLPILLCTCYSEELPPQNSAAGIKGFVMKPLVVKELDAEIRKSLGRVSAEEVPNVASRHDGKDTHQSLGVNPESRALF